MTKEMITITQNEAATLPRDSKKTLYTDKLKCCVGIVLRGPLGFTLIHFSQNTNINCIINEMNKLGAGTKIKLFKWSCAEGDLVSQIRRHLFINDLSDRYIGTVILDPARKLTYGSLEVSACKDGEPDLNTMTAVYATNSADISIDFGPQDLQMRAFKAELSSRLEPDKYVDLCVIYHNNEWKKAFELETINFILLCYLFEVVTNEKELKTRIAELLISRQDTYKRRFKFIQDWLQGNADDDLTIAIAFVDNFAWLLKCSYEYAQQSNQSFEPYSSNDKPIKPKATMSFKV